MQINVLNYLTLNELVISEIKMGVGKRTASSIVWYDHNNNIFMNHDALEYTFWI